MNSKKHKITKMSGEEDYFDELKLINSLERSGASDEAIHYIVRNIKNELFDGITTKDIYKKAFQLLKKTSKPTAARYKLKKAILELGPTGYNFEKFISKLMQYQGFTVQVGIILEGHCVSHEIDVLAKKDNQVYIIECKFHSIQSRKCDIKIPLYIKSRFEDVKKAKMKYRAEKDETYKGWIITNTRFTSDAIQYGNCSGLSLVSWDSPRGSSLRERIDVSGLYPITSLTSLTKREKQLLLEANVILVIDLCDNPDLLKSIDLKNSKRNSVLKEANELCRRVI